MSHRATYSSRYLDRVAIERPQLDPPRRRLTDEEIQLLPEGMRPLALMVRSFSDSMEQHSRNIAASLAQLAARRGEGQP